MRFERSADSRVKYKKAPSMGVFEFQSLLDNLDKIEELNPVDATIYTVWDTYWDLNYANEYPHNKGQYNHHWMNILDQKKLISIKVWERVKKSIHTAMIYSAKAIKWAVGDYFKCCRNYKDLPSKIRWNEIKRVPISLFASKYSFRRMGFSL